MYDIFASTTANDDVDLATVAVASSLVKEKINRLAADLELFAGHARRTIINTDDVKLSARNNPKLVRFFCIVMFTQSHFFFNQ